MKNRCKSRNSDCRAAGESLPRFLFPEKESKLEKKIRFPAADIDCRWNEKQENGKTIDKSIRSYIIKEIILQM